VPEPGRPREPPITVAGRDAAAAAAAAAAVGVVEAVRREACDVPTRLLSDAGTEDFARETGRCDCPRDARLRVPAAALGEAGPGEGEPRQPGYS
jgi:hypothetical protein